MNTTILMTLAALILAGCGVTYKETSRQESWKMESEDKSGPGPTPQLPPLITVAPEDAQRSCGYDFEEESSYEKAAFLKKISGAWLEEQFGFASDSKQEDPNKRYYKPGFEVDVTNGRFGPIKFYWANMASSYSTRSFAPYEIESARVSKPIDYDSDWNGFRFIEIYLPESKGCIITLVKLEGVKLRKLSGTHYNAYGGRKPPQDFLKNLKSGAVRLEKM